MSDVKRVAVLGAGTMGMGIAHLCAARGLDAALYDISQQQLDAALVNVTSILARRVKRGKLTADERDATLGRIAVHTDLVATVKDADVVIEAAPERLELKVKLFSELLPHVPDGALLGSNTSSLSITSLGAQIEEPGRTVGLHFFNPPPVMPLLEIVRGLDTHQETVDRALAFAELLGKEPIVVNDVPGFASSRLGVALGAEAIRMVETGVASVADIDRAMKLGYRHPMGPLELTDLVGLDVRLAILEHLHREIGDQFRPPTLLRQMVRAGRVGKKAGIGFYRWTDDGPVPAS